MGDGLMLDGEFGVTNPTELVSITLPKPIVYDNCEWCFQFDDNEPYVFAAVENPTETPKVTFTINNTSESTITFTHNDRTFKIFARELTEDGKKLIKNYE
jgi:hypothetical protein